MAQIRRAKIISPRRVAGGHPDAAKLVYPAGCYGASLRGIRIAPQKMRLVMNQIRGEPVERAREILRFSNKRAAYYVDRVLLSALGNADAQSSGSVGAEDLRVVEAYCDEGARMKRHKAGPMGRARPIIRRTCHLTVVVGQPEAEQPGAPEQPAQEQAAQSAAEPAAAAETQAEPK